MTSVLSVFGLQSHLSHCACVVIRSAMPPGSPRVRSAATVSCCCAPQAQHLYLRNVHYLVKDGEAFIIDESTGRASNSRWIDGIHQVSTEH